MFYHVVHPSVGETGETAVNAELDSNKILLNQSECFDADEELALRGEKVVECRLSREPDLLLRT